jgi:hypothetical protein
VFQSAYHTSENLLICAPTGAGKTNVAMLTVLHEVSQHFLHGILQVILSSISPPSLAPPAAKHHREHGASLTLLYLTLR